MTEVDVSGAIVEPATLSAVGPGSVESGSVESADVAAEPILGSLSPSRAADFKTCPLLYRYRTIDRLPEPPSRVATRGTVVHAVLEELFDLPAAERTLATARAMVPAAWQRVLAAEPRVAELFPVDVAVDVAVDGPVEADGPVGTDAHADGQTDSGAELADWLGSAADLLDNYFALEDPSRLEPAGREQLVEVVVDGLRLRGYVDRLDISPAGDVRVVDYKTGSTPREAFEAKALFQMKFYALVLWRTRGVVPRQLRLMYLADTDTLSYSPDADELTRFERTLHAIWSAIDRATRAEDFRPSPSRLCEWCAHQALCPAFGGTPPPFPTESLAAAQDDRRPATATEVAR